MNILICYASTEGQTRKIARFCARTLIAAGHSVEVLPATDAHDLALAGFDGAILAGSVHMGRLQAELGTFARDHAAALNGMPSMLLQVSLAAAGEDAEERADLGRIAIDFCKHAGWDPGEIHHVAGAFRFTEYDFFKGWAMRYIAARKGQKIDPGTDTEFTDWEALARILRRWRALKGTPRLAASDDDASDAEGEAL